MNCITLKKEKQKTNSKEKKRNNTQKKWNQNLHIEKEYLQISANN